MQGTDSLESLLDAPAGGSQAMSEPQATAEPSAPVETHTEPTGVQDSAAPPADAKPDAPPEPETWTKQAVLDERRKRQELEKKLGELEARLTQPPKPQQPKPEEQNKPDWWSSPEEAAQHMQQQMHLQVFETKVAMSERLMRQQHQDYDEVSKVFAAKAQEDPRLLQQLMAHPFPAEFAYQAGQQMRLLDEIGKDPTAYRTKLREDLKAELMAELGQTAPPTAGKPPAQAQQQTPSVPRSLARNVSTVPRQANGQFASLDNRASLDELLG